MRRKFALLTSLALAGFMVVTSSLSSFTSYAAPKLIPYQTIQAESNFGSSGVSTARGIPGQVIVTGLEKDDYFMVKDVDFSQDVKSLTFNASSEGASIVEARLGSVDGPVLAKFRIGNTNGEFKDFTANALTSAKNYSALYFVGTYGSVDVDFWSATPADVTPEPEPEPEPTPVVTEGVTAEYTLNNWGSGYQILIKVKNNGTTRINSWKLKVSKADVGIDSSWCVNVDEDADYYIITPMSWNASLGAGESTEFGVQGSSHLGSSVRIIAEAN